VPYPLTALISDLHGNWPALQTALADARARGATRYVCLGDVVGYGARPRDCVLLVMELVAGRDPTPGAPALVPGICLRGNHEDGLLGVAEDFNPKARAAIDWTRDELTRRGADNDALWEFLDACAPWAEDELAMYAHGSPRDPLREYMLPRDVREPAKMRACFQRMTRRVCFVGHSHVPAVYTEDLRCLRPRDAESRLEVAELGDQKLIVNVGSVGQPRDGDARLSYALWDGATIAFRRLEYDIAEAMREIRAVSDLPEYLAERLAVGR
jgi:diadenosine tetraphosphatase ApaH/serine/threonine PP2A family protein phosphatase